MKKFLSLVLCFVGLYLSFVINSFSKDQVYGTSYNNSNIGVQPTGTAKSFLPYKNNALADGTLDLGAAGANWNNGYINTINVGGASIIGNNSNLNISANAYVGFNSLIQATGINFGGNSNNLNFYASAIIPSVAVQGLTTAPAITVKQTRIGNIVVILLTSLGKYTKDANNGALTFAIGSDFACSDSWVAQQQIVNNVYQGGLWRINGAGISMYNGPSGANIPAGTTNVGWDVPIILTCHL